ncbi:MAG: sulfatase [Phycisphaerae bacterium]
MNVLFLVFDDYVPLVSRYGQPVTPHMDRLAQRGVRFDNAYTPCAICAPGRACLFTGLRPDTHGVDTLHNDLRGKLPDVITWPQALRSRGWYTMRSGKVYHKGVPECNVGSDGDDDPYSWCEKFNPTGLDLNCDGIRRNYTPRDTHEVGSGGAIQWVRALKSDDRHHDYHVASDLCRAIRRRAQEDNCLWAAGFIRPHVPLVAPERFFELYDDAEIDIPDEHADATDQPDYIRRQWCSEFGLTRDQRIGAIKAYLACVSLADEQIGRILDTLDDEGLADDTLIVLTGDHGFQLGEHGLWFKNYLYRESVSIPLTICDPRRPGTHGRTCDALVEQPDLFPTLCDLLGFEVAQKHEGVSLTPLLDDPDVGFRDGVLAQVNWGRIQGRSVRTCHYFYTEWVTPDGSRKQLFDLKTDPREEVDLLTSQPDDPVAGDMSDMLRAGWRNLLWE